MVQTLGGCQVIHTTHEKAPGACNTEGLETDTTNDLNFATGQRHGKAGAMLKVQFALHGHAVHTMPGGDFLVCKYGLSFYAADIEALQAFARRLGVIQ